MPNIGPRPDIWHNNLPSMFHIIYHIVVMTRLTTMDMKFPFSWYIATVAATAILMLINALMDLWDDAINCAPFETKLSITHTQSVWRHLEIVVVGS